MNIFIKEKYFYRLILLRLQHKEAATETQIIISF
jgi:hypothetical protein